MIYTEHVCKERIQEAQYCLAFDKASRTILNTYLNKYDEGKNGIQVKYHQPRDDIPLGRYFAEKSLSLQNFSKPIRHTLVKDTHTDIDMVNAHPQMLFQFCNKNKGKYITKFLKLYVTDRDKYLNMFMEYFQTDRKTAKEMFLVVMYLGSWKKYLNDHDLVYQKEDDAIVKFISNFSKEMAKIADIIAKDQLPDIYDILVTNPNPGKSPKSSCLSYFIGDIENTLLLRSACFLKNNGIQVETLCFDGLLVLNNDKLDDKLLTDLQKYILNKEHNGVKYNIKFDYKVMDEAITEITNYTIPTTRCDIPYLCDIGPDLKWCEKHIEVVPVYEKPTQTQIKEIKKIEEHNANIFIHSEVCKKADYFEQHHAKVLYPSCCLNISSGTYRIIGEKDFFKNYKNVKVGGGKDFISKWLDLKMVRTYDSLDFLPPPLVCPTYKFNTFTGFDCVHNKLHDPPPNLDFFRRHLHVLCGKEDRCTDYMMYYLADMIQRPGIIPKVSIVFRSVQGVGKNIFFDTIGKFVLGERYWLQTAEIDDILGRFNLNNNKLLVIMDELSGKATFESNEKIKNLITAPTLKWEAKGVDCTVLNNSARYIGFTNNETPVKLQEDERRFMIFDACDDFSTLPPDERRVYFKDLYHNLTTYAREIHDMLMAIDLTDWTPADNRFKTEAYKEVQSANIPTLARFLVDKCQNECNEDGTYNDLPLTRSTEIFEEYTTFVECSKLKFTPTIQKFGKDLKQFIGNGIVKKDKEQGAFYSIEYQVLWKYLVSKDYTI